MLKLVLKFFLLLYDGFIIFYITSYKYVCNFSIYYNEEILTLEWNEINIVFVYRLHYWEGKLS